MKKLLGLLFMCTAIPTLGMLKNKTEQCESKSDVFYLEIDTNGVFFEIYATIDEKIAGYCRFYKDQNTTDQAYIEKLIVYDPYRKQGIGSTLFEKAIFSIRHKGFLAVSWNAQQIREITTHELEKIYFSMVMKLPYSIRFIIGQQTQTDNIQSTPMKIIFNQ